MATYERRSGSWRVKVHRRGVKVSRTFPTKLQAQEWAAQVERDALKGEYRSIARSTFGDLLRRYTKDAVPNRRGQRWESIRLAAFQEREKPLCALPLSSVDVSTLEAWRDRRLGEVSASTVRREIALLGAVFSQAVRWGLIRANPLKDVRKPAPPPSRRRGIGPHEISAIIAALGNEGACKQIAQAFLLSLETAMRAGEILGLTWDHVDLQNRVVTLPRTKNGDSRQVPLSAAAVKIIASLNEPIHDIPPPNTTPPQLAPVRVFAISSAVLDVLFRRARDRASVDYPSCRTVRFHDARSEAITRLSRKLDVLELARVVGHRNLGSLLFYYRATAAEIAKKLD